MRQNASVEKAVLWQSSHFSLTTALRKAWRTFFIEKSLKRSGVSVIHSLQMTSGDNAKGLGSLISKGVMGRRDKVAVLVSRGEVGPETASHRYKAATRVFQSIGNCGKDSSKWDGWATCEVLLDKYKWKILGFWIETGGEFRPFNLILRPKSFHRLRDPQPGKVPARQSQTHAGIFPRMICSHFLE